MCDIYREAVWITLMTQDSLLLVEGVYMNLPRSKIGIVPWWDSIASMEIKPSIILLLTFILLTSDYQPMSHGQTTIDSPDMLTALCISFTCHRIAFYVITTIHVLFHCCTYMLFSMCACCLVFTLERIVIITIYLTFVVQKCLITYLIKGVAWSMCLQ